MNSSISPSCESRELLIKMLRVLYPHDRFGNGPYEKAADAIISASESTPAQTLILANGLRELEVAKFDSLDTSGATAYLKSIEGNPFFVAVTGTGLVALYNDHEVWKILGYEGPSYDLGGYIDRGFNNLDWLPEPRITEFEGV